MKKLLLIFILSILGIAGILYYQNFNSPFLAGSMVYQPYGGTGTSTKNWNGGCVNVTSGVWGTTSCGGGGGGSADQYWMASDTSIYNTTTANVVIIGDDGTSTGGYQLEVNDSIYARDKITSQNFIYGSYLIGNAVGALDMRSDPWSIYGSVDLEILDGNLKLSTTGDSYIYTNGGVDYILWDDDVHKFFFSDDIGTNGWIGMASTTITGSTTLSALTSCGKLFTDAGGTVVCGVDSTGGSGGVDTWNISGTVMTATDTVRDVKITTASTTLASTTISGPLTYASTSKWDLPYYWLVGTGSILMSYNQASSTYLITGTSTAGITINAAKQIGTDGLICKYSDATTTLFSNYMTSFATSVFALDTDLSGYMTNFATSVFALDTDLSIYMTNFATSMFMTTFATSVFALDTDLSAYMTTFATSVFALDTDLSGYMTTFATSVFLTNQTGLTTFATSVFVLDTDYSNYLVGTTSKETVNFSFGRATTSQFNVPLYFTPPTNITITELGCFSDGSMTIECGECAENSIATSSQIANLACGTASASTTSFIDAAIAQRNKVKCRVSILSSGTSTWAYIRYTK